MATSQRAHIMEKFIAINKSIFKSYHGKQWSPNLSGFQFVKPKLTDETCRLTEKRKDKGGFPINLAYSDLFEDKPNERKAGKIVVVISDEGVGKTTLCMSFCNDWACERLFRQFKLLLYLPLHHKTLVAVASLYDLLKLLYPGEKEGACASLAGYIDESKGKNMLIIADGWEKLDDSQRQNCSFLSEMLIGRIYPDMSVLLTVHSSSLALLPGVKCIDQVVRIHGFSNKQIEQYIKHELTEANAVTQLLAQLQSNPLLEIVCSIPVICATICHMWHTHQEDLPTTLTKLYTKLVLHIVTHSFKYKYILDIPEELKLSWKHLCEFAFQSLEDNHSFFSSAEIASYFQSDQEKIQRFGLLQLSQSFIDVENFQFLHQNFQRYLAAQHLANLSSKMQLEVFSKHARKDSFNLVWKFFFGLSFTNCKFEASSTIVKIKRAVQILYKSSNDRLQLCHCAFEAGNVEFTREVIKAVTSRKGSHNIISHFGELHTPYDSTAVINVIANIQKCTAIEVNFSNCSLSDKQIHEFECALSNVQVTGLNLSYNNLADSIVSRLFDMAPHAFHRLKKLYVRNNCIENEGINGILKALKQSPSPTLTHLDLSYNPLTKSGLERLQDGVSSGALASLEVLFMRQCLTENAEFNIKFLSTFAKSISLKCHSLQRVDLFANDLGEPSSPALSQIISCLTDLRKDFDLCLNREYMSEVDAKFISVMEQSLKEKGTIDHTVVHGMIVGPGRSGKDSLMKRLIKEGPQDPNTVSPSTGVLERVVKVEVKKLSAVAVADSYVSWRTLYHDEEALELMMSTAKSHSESDIRVITFDRCEKIPTLDVMEYFPYDTSKTEYGEKASLSIDHELVKRDVTYAFLSNELSNVHTSMFDNDNVTESPKDLLKKAVKCRRMDVLRDHLESSWTLYLTNTGGQLEYQELLPVLVCGPLVFFITFPLNADFNKRYTVRHEDQNGVEKKYESPSTMIDEILQILSTVSALKSMEPQHNITLKPKVFLVGTHKDKLPTSDSVQIIQRIDQELENKVRSTSLFDQGSIEFASYPDRLIFTVNNLAENDDDFQRIRSALQKCVERKNDFKVKNCPSSWLIFSLVLRAQHKSKQVLSYEECFTIAKRCGISDMTELNHALFFIHTRLGLVRYFSVKGLNTLVVIDPQVLFDRITTFLNETFVTDYAEVTEIEDFKRKGIFSLEVMERISQKYHPSSIVPFGWLVNLLIYLRIAVMFTDSKEERKCFFPSALCHAKDATSTLSDSLSTTPSILIAFESGFCPRGIPGALIVELMSNRGQSGLFWCLRTNRIYKNQVSFGVGAGSITIKIFPTHIEIAFDYKPGTMTESEVYDNCGETFEQIKEAMKNATSRYNSSGASYYFTFYCIDYDCKNRPHPAKMDWNRKMLRCNVSQRACKIPDGYSAWIEEKKPIKGDVHVSNLILTSKHLGRIADYMDQWEGRISEELGLTSANVAAIKLKFPCRLEMQIREALNMWKKKLGCDATNRELVNVFFRSERCDIADFIEKMFTSETTDCKYSLEQPTFQSRPLELPVFPAPTKCIVLSEDDQSSVSLPTDKMFDYQAQLNKDESIFQNLVLVPPSHLSTHLDISRIQAVDEETLGESQLERAELAKQEDTKVKELCDSSIPSRLAPPSPFLSLETSSHPSPSDELLQIRPNREPEVVGVDLEVFISEISKLIGLEWKFLARALEFEQTDIDAIEYKDIRNLKEQIYQMFHEWKIREGQRATAGRLLSAIKEAELHELLKGLREKSVISLRLQSSAALASSLSAGAQALIQLDDFQLDGPVRPKATLSAVSASVQGHTPPTERDFVRQQRLKRFSSNASDKSNSEMVAHTTVERMTSHDSTGSSLQSPGAVGVVESSTEKTGVFSPLSPNFGVFDVGNVIQVDRPESTPWYGVIKWIGHLGESTVVTAGIEMEHEVKGGGSGSFQGTQYFSCPEGLGVFLPVCRLKRDSRFEDTAPSESSPKSQMEGGVGTVSQPGDSPTSTRSNLSDLLSNLRKFELQEPSKEESEASGAKGFELQIPADREGLVIGAGGKNIREVERLTNTSIKVDGGPGQFGGQNRKVLVIGSEENCKKALFMIMKNIKRRVDEHTAGVKTISVPESAVGKIIGKGGATISNIKSLSGAHDIKIEDRKTGLEALLQTERECYIHGSEEAIEKAEKFIRLAVAGEDIVAGATLTSTYVELLKSGQNVEEFMIIAEVMDKNGLYLGVIPEEFDSNPANLHHVNESLRYFRCKGFGRFDMHDSCSRSWMSAHAWCVLDLKKQCIAYRFAQKCKSCRRNVVPTFDMFAVQRMAEFAVHICLTRMHNIKKEALPIHDVNYLDTRSPHDEESCQMCTILGHSCWK